jgi:hypothetical protein
MKELPNSAGGGHKAHFSFYYTKRVGLQVSRRKCI